MSNMPKIPEHAKMRVFHGGYPDEPTHTSENRATKPPGGGNGYPDGDVLMLQLWQAWAERTDNPEAGQLFKRVRAELLAARADADALRAEADARFAIYGRLLRGIQRTINGDEVQDHQLRAAIRALIGKMADEFAAMQPWDPDAPKIVQSAALAATPEPR